MEDAEPADSFAPSPVTPRDLLLLVALGLLALLRYRTRLFSPQPLIDEAIYLDAFRRTAAGLSPYGTPAFFYLPSFASAGAWALGALRQESLLALLRATNLVGAAWLVWLSARLTGLSFEGRTLLAAAVLLLSPGISFGFDCGNGSAAFAAAIVLGLLVWRRQPVAAGILLSGSLVLKPLSPPAILVLAAHRTDRPFTRRQLLFGTVLGGGTALLVGYPFLADFLRLRESVRVEVYPLDRAVSLHRFLFNLGIEIDRVLLFLSVAVVALVVSRLRIWSRIELACLGIAALVLAAPMLWSHTLMVTLPLQAVALRKLLARPAGSGSSRRLETLAVAACLSALQFSDGIKGLLPGPSLAVAAAIFPILLAPLVLTAWIAHRPAAPP